MSGQWDLAEIIRQSEEHMRYEYNEYKRNGTHMSCCVCPQCFEKWLANVDADKFWANLGKPKPPRPPREDYDDDEHFSG